MSGDDDLGDTSRTEPGDAALRPASTEMSIAELAAAHERRRRHRARRRAGGPAADRAGHRGIVDRMAARRAADLRRARAPPGRLGVLDASECPPTFGTPPELSRGDHRRRPAGDRRRRSRAPRTTSTAGRRADRRRRRHGRRRRGRHRRERAHPVRDRRARARPRARRPHRRPVVQRRTPTQRRRRAPDRGGRRPRGGRRLDAAQGRHGAEARAQHDLDHRDGPARQDVREPDGRPARRPTRSCASGRWASWPTIAGVGRPPARAALEAAGFDVKAAVLVASLGVTPNEATRPTRRGRTGGSAGAAGGNEPMKVLGMISGTSHDGIDVAVVDLSLTGDDAHRRGRPRRQHAVPRPTCAPGWCAALPPAPTTLAEVCELDTLIGQAFAEVAAAVVAGVPGRPDRVARPDRVPLGRGRARAGHAPARAAGLDRRAHRRAGGVRRAHPRHHRRRPRRAARVVPRRAAARRHRRAAGGAEPRRHLEHDGRRPGRRPSYAYDIGPANALVDAVVARTGADAIGYDDGGRLAAAGPVRRRPAGRAARRRRTTTCRRRRAPARSTSTSTTSTRRWRAPASIWPSPTWSPR